MADAVIRDAVRNYIVKERRLRKPPTDDERLVTGGIIDSFALVDLQIWLEKTYGVKVDDTDMIVDNMDSVAMIADWIEGHR